MLDPVPNCLACLLSNLSTFSFPVGKGQLNVQDGMTSNIFGANDQLLPIQRCTLFIKL